MKPFAGAFAHVAREAMVARSAAVEAGPMRIGYVPAAARSVPVASPVPVAVIDEKRLNATAVPAPRVNSSAVIVLSARTSSVAVPAVPPTPNVSEPTDWLALASTRRPPAAIMRSVLIGNMPPTPSSHTPPFSMTVGPSQCCDARNRKPEFFVAFIVRIVMPCATSSGWLFVAVNEQLTVSILLAVAPLPVRKTAPRVPMHAVVRSALIQFTFPSARCSAMPPSKRTCISHPSPVPFFCNVLLR